MHFYTSSQVSCVFSVIQNLFSTVLENAYGVALEIMLRMENFKMNNTSFSVQGSTVFLSNLGKCAGKTAFYGRSRHSGSGSTVNLTDCLFYPLTDAFVIENAFFV